jgi:hypothetical protein
MWTDPIVEEVQNIRQEYAAKFNYDLKAICRDLRERQKQSGRNAIVRPPKPVCPELPKSRTHSHGAPAQI